MGGGWGEPRMATSPTTGDLEAIDALLTDAGIPVVEQGRALSLRDRVKVALAVKSLNEEAWASWVEQTALAGVDLATADVGGWLIDRLKCYPPEISAGQQLRLLDAARPQPGERWREAHDRFLSLVHEYLAEHVEGSKGVVDGRVIPYEVVVQLVDDVVTDERWSFFNRCPACSCETHPDAEGGDCGCWCHDLAEGWRVWQERVADLEALLAGAVSQDAADG